MDKDIFKCFSFLAELEKNIPEDTTENRGKPFSFKCPLCGGTVNGVRSEYNGHVHAKCSDCGFGVME